MNESLNIPKTITMEDNVKESEAKGVDTGNQQALDLYDTNLSKKKNNTETKYAVTTFNSNWLLPEFIPNLLRMFTKNCTTSLLYNIIDTNLVKYIMYESNYINSLMLLDIEFISSKIQNVLVEPLNIKKMYITDKSRQPTYYNKFREDIIDTPVEENIKFKISEKNTFLNNRVRFELQELVDENYVRSGQYDTAISIFNIEKTGWDATMARLKKNLFEMFKMDCMKHNYLLPMKNLNFIREGIGRVVVNKNKRVNFFEPKKLTKFIFDPTSDKDRKQQFAEYTKDHPLGFVVDKISSTNFNIGKWKDENETREYMHALTRVQVIIHGFDSTGIYDMTDQEIYISKASDYEEFFYEFRCLIGYILYNPTFRVINFINPLLNCQFIDNILKQLITKDMSYVNIELPAIQLYQHFLTYNYCDKISLSINKINSNDLFTILKATTIYNMKIQLDDKNFMELFDYRNAVVQKRLFSQYGDKSNYSNVVFQDSYYMLRILAVLGLVIRTVGCEIEVPRRFVEVRNYMREFSRIMATSSDYIIQRTVGSYNNIVNADSTTYKILQDISHLMIFMGLGSNIGLDDLGNFKNNIEKNSLIWCESYIRMPDIENTNEDIGNNLMVTRRLDWNLLDIYVNVGCWNFGNIYDGKQFNKNVRDYDINLEDNYREIRNGCVRYNITDDKCIKIGVRKDADIYYCNLNIKGAICSIFGHKRYTTKYLHFCEIPTLLIFSLSKNFFIHNVYYNNLLPTFKVGWLNVYDYYQHYTNIYNDNTNTDNMHDLFLKAQ